MLLYRKTSLLALLDPSRWARNLWQHRRLLWQFTRRGIEAPHRGSALGSTWSLLSPLLLFGTYAFVFGFVFEARFGVEGETRLDFVLGLFLGLTLTQFLLDCMTASPMVVVQNPNFVKKVVFPLEILPASAVGAALFRCLVSLVLVLGATWMWGRGLHWNALWLLPLLAIIVILGLGVAWTVAALGVFVRDMVPLMQFAALIIMFMSAIFYPVKAIPDVMGFLRYNPLLIIVESARNAVLWQLPYAGPSMAALAALALVVCVLGYAFFSALKSAFADVL
jgi:lipopolysaccharide transport system permease protein